MKVKLITLGCPKNLVDSEHLAGGLHANGIEFVHGAGAADAAIINTCGFIDSAKEESIEAILAAVADKKSGKFKKVFVTGCLSERYGADLVREIPELDGVYGNRDLQNIVQSITEKLDLRYELLGERELLTPKHYAYLKISEGCEHPCTFCAIPGIRGNFQSQPLETLLAEAQRLAARGVRELVLIAQDTTIYGEDLYGEKRLPELLLRLTAVEGIEWIRLMYAYPYHVTDELIATIAGHEKICKYIDMPVQHVSQAMLKRMARRVSAEEQDRLIQKIRAAIPDLVLRTSVIVGFPGETEQDFLELYDYVMAGHFDRLGVFTFSLEEGTPAARLPGQIPEPVQRERQDMLIQAQDQAAEAKNAALVGKTMPVLIDEWDAATGLALGRTEGDCPEVDNSVLISQPCQVGEFCDITITGATAHDLYGVVGKVENVRSTRISVR